MWAGDSYLERPCEGWSVVYGLHDRHTLIRYAHHSLSLSVCVRHSIPQLGQCFIFIFITCGEPAFSVDALVDRPSKLSRSGFTY